MEAYCDSFQIYCQCNRNIVTSSSEKPYNILFYNSLSLTEAQTVTILSRGFEKQHNYSVQHKTIVSLSNNFKLVYLVISFMCLEAKFNVDQFRENILQTKFPYN